MKNITIGRDGFKLPLAAVTQTFAVLAIRGAGKTNTCVVMAEEMLSAGAQVVVIDPTNSWWGLRSSRDGKDDGFPITVLGGDHGDIPLEPTAGKVLAEFVVQSNASVIFSVRHMSKSSRYQFVADFGERLFQLKDTHRTPMHLILDEADRFVPQRIQPDQTRMFGAVDDLVRLGRSSGIGVSLISQRAAVINKDVLSQTENLICLRTIGKHDRTALEDWAEAHSSAGEMKQFMDSLASLDRGEAWIWSPFWLKVFERVHIRERNTFDSSATPEFGKVALQPKRIAPVDLNKLQQDMAATIQRAKADDPRELKKNIAELQKQLKAVPAADPEAIKRAVDAAIRENDVRWFNRIKDSQEYVGRAIDATVSMRATLEQAVLTKTMPTSVPPQVPAMFRHAEVPLRLARPIQRANAHVETNGNLSGPAHKILDSLHELEVLGIPRPKRIFIALLAGYSNLASTGFAKAMSSLGSAGHIRYPDSDSLEIAESGRFLAQDVNQPRSAEELQNRVYQMLGGVKAALLKLVVEAYPSEVSKENLAAKLNYTNLASTGFAKALSSVSGLGLTEYPSPGMVRARPFLFLEQ